MIKTEVEYQKSIERLKVEAKRLKDQRKRLPVGCSKQEAERILGRLRARHDKLKQDIADYESLKQGQFNDVRNLVGIGQVLTAIRIHGGVTQRDLAERIGVHESQISRDERTGYQGASVDRIQRILEALNAEVTTKVVNVPKQAVAKQAVAK